MNNQILELVEQHFGNDKYSMFQQLNKIEERLIYLQVLAEGEYGSGYSEKELEEQNAFFEEIYMVRKLQNFLIDLQSIVEKKCIDLQSVVEKECDEIYS